MDDYEEVEFLETLVTLGTDEDWADFWGDEEPMEILMNDRKLEEAHG